MDNNPETRVIAHCLYTEGASSGIFSSGLKSEHFSLAANRCIMQAMFDCWEKGKNPSVVSITDLINYIREDTDYYEAVGGDQLKDRLVSLASMELGSWQQDSRRVQELYHQRELASGLQIAASIAAQQGNEAQLSELMNRINQIQQAMEGNDPLVGVTSVDDLLLDLETIEEMPDFIPTRYPGLNRSIGYDPVRGGLVRGAVHSIIGAPGSGKSTFTISLLVGFLQAGKTVAYANYEIAKFIWDKFFFANCTGCNPFRIREYPEGFFTGSKENFQKLLESWRGRLFVKHSHDTLFYEDIENWVKDLCREVSVDVLIVDTLQSLEVFGRKTNQRWQIYEYIMMRLERLAIEQNIAIIITGQENVNRMREGREEASMADTGGSISIEQKSAVVMHLIIPQTEDVDTVEIQITKNRVVGTSMTQRPVQFIYDDHYKGHREYEPRPSKQEEEVKRVASRIKAGPDPNMLD
jgi:replicative DNA helicase